jgi:hypothetical protein
MDISCIEHSVIRSKFANLIRLELIEHEVAEQKATFSAANTFALAMRRYSRDTGRFSLPGSRCGRKIHFLSPPLAGSILRSHGKHT